MNTYKAHKYLKKNKTIIGFRALDAFGNEIPVTLFDIIASNSNIDINNVTVDDAFNFKINKKDTYVYIFNKVFNKVGKKKCLKIKSNIDLEEFRQSIEDGTSLGRRCILGMYNKQFKWSSNSLSMAKVARELLRISLENKDNKNNKLFNHLLLALAFDIHRHNLDIENDKLIDSMYSAYSFLKPIKIFGGNASLAYPFLIENPNIDSLDDIADIIADSLINTTLIVLDPSKIKIGNDTLKDAYSKEGEKLLSRRVKNGTKC